MQRRPLLLIALWPLLACGADDLDPTLPGEPDLELRRDSCAGPEDWQLVDIGEPRPLHPGGSFPETSHTIELSRDGTAAIGVYHHEHRAVMRALGLGGEPLGSPHRVLEGAGPGIHTAHREGLTLVAGFDSYGDWARATFELYDGSQEHLATANWTLDRGFGLPAVAMDATGDTVVARSVGNVSGVGYDEVVLRWLGSDGQWMGPQSAYRIDGGISRSARVAVTDEGHQIAVAFTVGPGVRVQRFDADLQAVGVPIALDPSPGLSGAPPTVEYLPGGALVVGYPGGSDDAIFLARIEPDDEVSSIIETGLHSWPDIGDWFEYRSHAMDASGTGVIAVAANPHGASGLGVRLFGPDLAPIGPIRLHGPGAPMSAHLPDVSIAECGPRLVTTWPVHTAEAWPGLYTEMTPAG